MTNRQWYRVAVGDITLALVTYTGLFTAISDLNFHSALQLDAPLAGWLHVGLFATLLWIMQRMRHCKIHRVSLAVMAALCALAVMLDRSFVFNSNWDLLFGSARQFSTACWVWLAMTLCLHAVLCLVADVVWRSMSMPCHTPVRTVRAYRTRFLLNFGLILLCWLPHIIMQMPGHIETTAGQQIRIAYGELPLTQDNPVLHTLLIKLLIKGTLFLGLSDTMAVFAVSLSQLLPLAAALTWTLMILDNRALPAVYIGALRWFYALCPLFPLYGLFIVKDVPFAVAILLLTCVLAELVLKREAFLRSRWNLLLWIGIGVLVCLLRNAAVALFGLTVIAVLLWLRLDAKVTRRLIASSLLVLAIYGGFTLGIDRFLQVGMLETRQAENRSAQCQIVARVVKFHSQELTMQELTTIDACIPLEGLAERYQPEVSDPVKDTWRVGVTAMQSSAFDQLTASLLVRYPGESAQAILQMAIPYLAPGDIGRFRAMFDCGFSNIDVLYPVFAPDHLFPTAVFRSTLDFFQRQTLIAFFCCSGFYAWLLIGSFTLSLTHRKSGLWVCWLPAILVLVGCFLSPVAGYIRYALPFMFTAPFLAYLMLSALREPRIPQVITPSNAASTACP